MKNSGFKAYLCAYHSGVTGSKIIVVVNYPNGRVRRIMVDDGCFQERKYEQLNYVNEIDPKNIDTILITHSHIDHIGMLPKFVKDGYNNKIYMTKQAKMLCSDFLQDAANRQKETARILRKKYPEQKKVFQTLYSKNDISAEQKLVKGLEYREEKEILPGVKVTFFENGHLLGAAMIWLRISCEDMEDINFFFTGDYKLTNCFYPVPELPKEVKEKPLIMIHETTNGQISSKEINKNFWDNMIKAFSERKNVLIGAFAQGRMQEILYDFKCKQDENIVPSEYVMYVDGNLGISTNAKYRNILLDYNPDKADFIPKRCYTVLDDETRARVLLDTRPKIIITTSGMLSDGPARFYVPIFLEMEDTVIQLIGYAAEGTLARALLDGKKAQTVKFAGRELVKQAEVKSTREKSGHAFNDEMIEFINKFSNIKFMALNHGSIESQEYFRELVLKETNVENVELLNRENAYVIYQNTPKGADYCDIKIKHFTTKHEEVQSEKEKQSEKRKTRRVRKTERKAKNKARKNSKKRKAKKQDSEE